MKHYVLGILLFLFPYVLFAAELPVEDLTSSPVEISSNRMVADGGLHSVVFHGDVVAKQADLVIYSDVLEVTYSPDKRVMQKADAKGNVRVVRGDQVATSEHAVYDNISETIFLEGSPRVKQGDSFLEGDQITIFLREQRSVIHGADGGRVNATFSPEDAPK